MKEKLFLIDGTALIYRAYYAFMKFMLDINKHRRLYVIRLKKVE
jgi:5'-3' exonuclease